MLQEAVVIDRIEVTETGVVQVREATRVFRGDVMIAQTYDRRTLAPGQDISDQPDQVQAVCNAVWTPEVIAAYQASQETKP